MESDPIDFHRLVEDTGTRTVHDEELAALLIRIDRIISVKGATL